jgi:hypothetical protein
MIVWGGYPNTNTGGRYYPATDSWIDTLTENAPSARYGHTAVWTGTQMIVWAGDDGSSYLNSGARYYPYGEGLSEGDHTFQVRAYDAALNVDPTPASCDWTIDLGLPDMDGVEVCTRLREWSQCPIIILSVRDSERDKVPALDKGADDYLTKPIRPSDLVSRIEAVLLRSGRRTGKEQLPLRARIIGFIGAKGGVGTSTLAVNVAAAMALEIVRGKQVVLADLRSGSLDLDALLSRQG